MIEWFIVDQLTGDIRPGRYASMADAADALLKVGNCQGYAIDCVDKLGSVERREAEQRGLFV